MANEKKDSFDFTDEDKKSETKDKNDMVDTVNKVDDNKNQEKNTTEKTDNQKSSENLTVKDNKEDDSVETEIKDSLEEKVHNNILDKIDAEVEKKYEKVMNEDIMFITLSDENRNFWNSADELHFFVTQGRCKELPDKLTPILEKAMSDENPLLREATEEEIRKELFIRTKEEFLIKGLLKPSELNDIRFEKIDL